YREVFQPQVDALLQQARTAYHILTLKRLYSEVQQMTVNDPSMVASIFSAEYGALLSNVRGFEWIHDQIPGFREVRKV
ncbi:MAG TPA: hypothetical protein VKB76_02110, partial [Ktedonobacterales bacterium]|nr:hypothetical protein [Ktedonobacterales bacterium]